MATKNDPVVVMVDAEDDHSVVTLVQNLLNLREGGHVAWNEFIFIGLGEHSGSKMYSMN